MRVNQQQLAEIFGKSPVTINNWQNAGMPVAKQGARGSSNEYDTAAVYEWLEKRNKATPKTKDLETERTRKVKIEASLASLDLAVRQGELISVADVEKEWVGQVMRMKARLRGIPARTATQLVMMGETAEVEALLSRVIDESLDELATEAAKTND